MVTKTEKIGDREFTFGELNYGQIEDFFGEGKKAVISDVMLTSLNNANPAIPWTLQSLREKLDGPASFRALRQAILEFSEIELGNPAGESPAAG
jgi:hypothetical protein